MQSFTLHLRNGSSVRFVATSGESFQSVGLLPPGSLLSDAVESMAGVPSGALGTPNTPKHSLSRCSSGNLKGRLNDKDLTVDTTIMNFEHIAETAHEANRAYCAALGDNSQPAWKDAPDWQKQSALTGVKFLLTHPEAPPSASHDSWLAEKQRDGWKYGPVKNPETKEHPCFCHYDELPVEQRAKDYIFGGVVRTMLRQQFGI